MCQRSEHVSIAAVLDLVDSKDICEEAAQALRKYAMLLGLQTNVHDTMNLIIANVGNEAWSVRGHELVTKAADLTSQYNATRDDLLQANPTFPVRATSLPTFQLNIFLRQALKAIRAKIKESLDEVENEVARGNARKAKELLDEVTEMWRDVDRVAGYIRAHYPDDAPALDEPIPNL